MGDAVSLVIPAYNAERFISKTLESALRQELPAREIIVVDDGSTDATAPLVEAFAPRGVRLIRQSNAGPGAARNAGITAATSSHVMFLDADDLLFPWSIVNALRAAGPGGAAIVLGQPCPFVDESELASVSGGAPTARRFPDLFDALRRWDFFLGAGGVVVRRDLLDAAHLFPTHRDNAEDLDFLLGLGLASPLMCIDHPPAFAYRRHAASASTDLLRTLRGMARLLDREDAGAYAGGPSRKADRAHALCVLAQGWSFAAVRGGQPRLGWHLYSRTLGRQFRRGNLLYALGFPPLALLHTARAARSSLAAARAPAPPSKDHR